MKNIILLSALLLPLTLFAKIWIVDSNPGSVSKDFTNLQEAHDGANAGDTLYLIGSGVSYITEKVTINKRLIIIGPGYFLNNPETQISLLPASINLSNNDCVVGLEFAMGSEGSAIIGTTLSSNVIVSTNNILIKRNHFSIGSCTGSGNHRITISGSSVQVIQNYIETTILFGLCVIVNSGNSNIFIRNNYMSAPQQVMISTNSGIHIENNYFTGGTSPALTISNALFQNNIINAPVTLTFNNTIVRNNISVANNLPAGDGNINSAPLANIFVGTGTTDGRWKLKDGSPAIGSGFEGVDMGMFGGDEPYVLSGIPPIPTIYQLNAPAVGEKNTGLPITVKAKANN